MEDNEDNNINIWILIKCLHRCSVVEWEEEWEVDEEEDFISTWVEWAVVVDKAAAAQDTIHSLAWAEWVAKVGSPSDSAEHQSSWTEAIFQDFL